MEGRGRAVFVIAPPGRATEDRIAAFQEVAFRRHARLRVAFVDCVYTTPENDAWIQFERILTRRYRLRGSARKLALDWIEVIPLVGPALRAAVLTVQALVQGRMPDEDRHDPASGSTRVARRAPTAGPERARELWTLEPLEPRLLVLENFQQAEPGELAGAATLVSHLEETRTMFVAVTRVEGDLPNLIQDLILEGERSGRARRIRLEGAIPADPESAPASVRESAAGGREAGATSGGEMPGSLQLGSPGLGEEDRVLLARAAVEGPVLHPLFLERLLGIPELELEDRFARLVRHGVLEDRGIEQMGGEPTGAYGFRVSGQRDRFLGALGPEERRELAALAERLRGQLGG